MKRRVPSRMLQYSDETVKTIDKMYNVNDDLLKDAIDHLSDWYRKQPHFPREPPDPIWLIGMFLANKCSHEVTKKKIDAQFTARTVMPEILCHSYLLKGDLKKVTENVQFLILRKLTSKTLSRVSIFNVRNLGDSFNIVDFFNFTYLFAEYRVLADYSPNNQFIISFENLKISQLAKLNPVVMKKCEIVLKKAYGIPVVAIHIINAPPFVDKFFFILKQALKPKLVERIKVHNNYDSLYEHVDREILPKDYGGDEKCIDELLVDWQTEFSDKFWIKKIEESDRLKTDESRRLGTTMDDDFSNMTGSFRKLDVD